MSLVLVLNCGSSSIKFALLDPLSKKKFLMGMIEQIASANAQLSFNMRDGKKQKQTLGYLDYQQAFAKILPLVEQAKSVHTPLMAIGHRVVHGGSAFTQSVVIDAKVLKDIEACVPLAPLHNPANILGIKIAQEMFPGIPGVAVFDTAFHQTMPDYAYVYALPYSYYQNYQVRRFGFHGISYRYLTAKAAAMLEKSVNETHLILVHLGNGCSICAVKNGESQDTSMGLTPLEGLVMGTRSGDIDPGIFNYLTKQLNISVEVLTDILNKKSGLLGITEKSMDMRDILNAAGAGDEQAKLAIEIFCYRLAKYIAAMMVPLRKIDALVFSGGIGENAAVIREKSLELVEFLGCKIDGEANKIHGENTNGLISAKNSIPIFVIPTNEELIIAEDCIKLMAPLKSTAPLRSRL